MASSTTAKSGLFVTEDGQRLGFTFALVCTLFFLWAMCNGMIDIMDKHFQNELGLTKSQSAWVQFAHHSVYFLMSMPAGILASKLGYKKGIIMGLAIRRDRGVLVRPGDPYQLAGAHRRRLG